MTLSMTLFRRLHPGRWLRRPAPVAGRIAGVDVAKGVGRVLVVWYHLDMAPGKFLNMFFMPLFFLLAGFFFKPEDDFKTFFRKKFHSLIGPFLAFCAAGALLEYFVYDMANWNDPMYAEWFTFYRLSNVPIWFLVCMTYVVFAAWAVERLRRPLWGYLALLAVAFAVGWPGAKPPFFIKPALMALPIFALGYYGRDAILHGSRRFVMAVTVVTVLSVALFLGRTQWYTNFHQSEFQRSFLSWFIPAVGMSILTLWLAMALAARRPHSAAVRALSWVGRYSLLVLGVHHLLVPLFLPLLAMAADNWPAMDYAVVRWALSLLAALIIIPPSVWIGRVIRRLVPWLFGYQAPPLLRERRTLQ